MTNQTTLMTLSASVISEDLIALYGDDGRTTWLSDRENISKENALKLSDSHIRLLDAAKRALWKLEMLRVESGISKGEAYESLQSAISNAEGNS